MFAIKSTKTEKYLNLSGKEFDKPRAHEIFLKAGAAAFYAHRMPNAEVIPVPEEDLPEILKRE